MPAMVCAGSGARPARYSARVPYEVSTPVFEGPFDLLLHLITREQVDIYEVSLSAIVDELRGRPRAASRPPRPGGGHRVPADRRRAARAQGPPAAARRARTSSSRRSSPSGRSGTCCWPACSSARRSRTPPAPLQPARWTPPAGPSPGVAGLEDRFLDLAPDLLAGVTAERLRRGVPGGHDAQAGAAGAARPRGPDPGSAWPTRSTSWSTSCPAPGRITFRRLTAELVERAGGDRALPGPARAVQAGRWSTWSRRATFGELRIDLARASTPTRASVAGAAVVRRRRRVPGLTLATPKPTAGLEADRSWWPTNAVAASPAGPAAGDQPGPGRGAVRRAGRPPTAPRTGVSCWSGSAGGYRFQSHPDLAPYVERFVLEGQAARLSAAALETLAIVAYKQPVSRAQVAVHPGRQRRRGDADPAASGATSPRSAGTRVRARPCCTAPRRCSSRGWASTRSTSCPRWPSSSPAPT